MTGAEQDQWIKAPAVINPSGILSTRILSAGIRPLGLCLLNFWGFACWIFGALPVEFLGLCLLNFWGLACWIFGALPVEFLGLCLLNFWGFAYWIFGALPVRIMSAAVWSGYPFRTHSLTAVVEWWYESFLQHWKGNSNLLEKGALLICPQTNWGEIIGVLDCCADALKESSSLQQIEKKKTISCL